LTANELLVVDIGTSSVRASIVADDSTVRQVHSLPFLPSSPAPSFVEFDPAEMARAVLSVCQAALDAHGPVAGIGIANQRASTVLWRRATGEPVGPGIGWQDLRTAGMCLMLREQGVRVAPNMSATKLAVLLDMADPGRNEDLCFGTVDSWVAWTISGGSVHVTDATNAGVTGLREVGGEAWDQETLAALRIPSSCLPEVVDSSGVVGEASALPGAPPICGILGDQQASLVGQGCTRAGMAKITFGTGGMLDACTGSIRPSFDVRGEAGCFPIVAFKRAGRITWGVEAVMLSAGTAVEWLRDDLGIISSAAESAEVASLCEDTGDVWFVPALLGLGTPYWDFGARATLLGATRGTGRPEIVRAVLEGVAHRGADLVEAAEADTGTTFASLRVDGGMSANEVFVAALADATGKPVEVSPVLEATTLGAAYMAGMALGIWNDEEELAESWEPKRVVEPSARGTAAWRARWREAVERAMRTVPELSELEF
jgi:glycerol kinase